MPPSCRVNYFSNQCCNIKCDYFLMNKITFLFKTDLFSKKKENFISLHPSMIFFPNLHFLVQRDAIHKISIYWNTSIRFSVKEQKSQLEVSSSKSSPLDINWNERRSKGSQSRNSKSNALIIENVNIYPPLIPCQSLIIRAIY